MEETKQQRIICDNCQEKILVTAFVEVENPEFELDRDTITLAKCDIDINIDYEMEQQEKMTELKK